MSILKQDSHEINHIKSKHQSNDYFIDRVTIGKKIGNNFIIVCFERWIKKSANKSLQSKINTIYDLFPDFTNQIKRSPGTEKDIKNYIYLNCLVYSLISLILAIRCKFSEITFYLFPSKFIDLHLNCLYLSLFLAVLFYASLYSWIVLKWLVAIKLRN
jgi:hypothetical protein